MSGATSGVRAEPDRPGDGVQDRLLTPANAVTAARFALAPVMLALLLVPDEPRPAQRFAALAVFVVAAVSDLVDGVLARRRGEVTRFGVVADPLADKVLVLAALAGVAVLGELPWWVVAVVLAREALVTAVRARLLGRGRLLPAVASGKAKTWVQLVTCAVLLLPPGTVPSSAVTVLVAATVGVTVVSGAELLARAVRPAPA